MQKEKWVLPMRPLEEIKMEVSSGSKNREANLRSRSIQYTKQYASLNESFKRHYLKTVIDLRTKEKGKDPLYIVIYSKKPLSSLQAYAILMAYQYEAQSKNYRPKREFLEYLVWCYKDFADIAGIEERLRLYEYVEDYLLIVLDVEPNELGINGEVMRCTRIFNEKESDGKYKTVIKAYIDLDIVVSSVSPLSIEEVKKIAEAHREAQSWACAGEDCATLGEFIEALQKMNFSKKVKSYKYEYEYQNDRLMIEIY